MNQPDRSSVTCQIENASCIVFFALFEDVVLGHAHGLHDHLDARQVDEAVLRQVALQAHTQPSPEPREFVDISQHAGQPGGHTPGWNHSYSGFVHHIFVDPDQAIYRPLSRKG